MGIGTATFLPGYGPTATGRPGPALLLSAFAAGVRYVDTAAAYGDSEAAIGEVASTIKQLSVRVATKLQPPVPTLEACRAAMGASLARLRLSSVDTVLMHSAAGARIASADIATVWRSLRDDGAAVRVGASTYGIAAATVAVASWCDVVQVEFSILNQSVVCALREAASRRIEVIARSVLCKGLLTSSAFALDLPDAARVTLRGLESMSNRLSMDLSTLAIRFALDTPGIDVVLVGVSDQAELDAAICAWRQAPLSALEYAEIAAFDRSDEDWTHPERWPEGKPAA